MPISSWFATHPSDGSRPDSPIRRWSARRLELILGVLLGVAVAPAAFADEVILVNGDRITGTIVSLVDGEMVVRIERAGELAIGVKKLKTFSTSDLLRIRLGDGAIFDARIGAGPDGKVEIRSAAGSAPQLFASTTDNFGDAYSKYSHDMHGAVYVEGNAKLALRGEYHHDSEPAPSAKQDEYRLMLGPGWDF